MTAVRRKILACINRRTGLLSILLPVLAQIAPVQAIGGPVPEEIKTASSEIQSATAVYDFSVNAVDPNAATNPKAAKIPGFRATNQLVLYTPDSHRSSTGTNQAGYEATVLNGVVITNTLGNSLIPSDGWVLSGHGSAAQWLQRFAQPGAEVAYNAETRQLHLRFTPAVYLNRIDTALTHAANALKAQPALADSAQHHYQEAQACRATLAEPFPPPLSPAWKAQAIRCQKEADEAFYQTLTAKPQEFRGAWIRPQPDDTEPGKIAPRLEEMKALGIRHIFLETYYQGKTIYPSKVMAHTGLAPQHPQFNHHDPLQAWIEAAHAADIKVYVWTQVFFAGNKDENVETYGPILQIYPQWRNIQRASLRSFIPIASSIEPGHYFLDPANPAVRRFLHSLILEIVTQYPIDGLNLDYIRYPASYPLSNPAYLNSTWGYTPIARKRFMAQLAEEHRLAAEAEKRARAEAFEKLKLAAEAAHLPSPKAQPLPTPVKVTISEDPKDLIPGTALWARWVDWRKEQVSSFVREVSEEVHQKRPELPISAVVFPVSDPTYAQKLQDYSRWSREGWIQALTPIGLSTQPGLMTRQAQGIRTQIQDKIPVYPGVFALYNRETPLAMLEEIEALHQAKMPGLVFFDWSRLSPEYRQALELGPFRQSD
jgi:uncharacterized lipoprotein YddW (UPF0748 family)